MACVTGTNIVNDGLVFHFDLENGVKSWKGKPTSNLVPDPTFTSQLWNTWSGRGADSWGYTEFDNSSCAYTDLSINTGERRQLYRDITVSSSLTTFALSIEAYVTLDCDATSVFANQEFPFGNNYGSLSYDLNNKGTWQKLYAIRDNAYGTDTNNIQTRYRFYFGTNNTSGTKGKIYFRNAQLEVGDITTKFVNGVRLDTASIVDVSPTQSTITAANLTYRQDDTPTFDGTNDYIDCGVIPGIDATATQFSVSVWLNTQTNSTRCIIENGTNYTTNTFYMFQENATYFTFEIYGTGHDVVYANFPYQLNTWYNLVGVWSSGNRIEFYANGVNVSGSRGGVAQTSVINGNTNMMIGARAGTSYPFWGEISQVKIYNRALTAQEVKQNFEATRSRYGI